MKVVIEIPEEMWEWLHNGFPDEDDGKHAINAILKGTPQKQMQEPFMNKPCVAHQICHEDKVKVLDKIRAEIQENINYNKKMNYQGIVAGLLLSLDIIDKYKTDKGE